MLERLEKIREYIRINGEAKLAEICALFPQVSEMTVRRDLERLEKSGDIVRTKGGAKSITHLAGLKEALFYKRAMENVEAKKAIALKANSLIKEGLSVFFDSGSTLMYLASYLKDVKANIVTADPNVAIKCAKNQNAEIYLTGGSLNRDNLTLSGTNTVKFLERINIDIAFMGASGYTAQAGFTCGSFNEGEVKRSVVEKAKKVAVLMDSTKLGRELPFGFASLSETDYFITDGNLPEEIIKEIKKIKKHKIEVI